MTVQGPLSGVRIIDLSQAHAGPYGSQLLGDLGADIIKIEAYGRGDMLRGVKPDNKGESYYILALNRNKKSIALNLRTESGKQAFYDLVKKSDVVYDNFRAGVIERLGIDYETVKKINPDIICASITGYGQSGPYKIKGAFDDIVQGIAGALSLCGEPGGGPLRPGMPIADLAGGFFCAMGVVVALYERQKSGKGSKVEVSLLDSTMSLMSNHFQNYFLSGKPPQPQGKTHPNIIIGVFETKDSYITLGPSWPKLATAIDKEWLLTDPRFDTNRKRNENKNELEKIIKEALLEKNTEEWLELFDKHDIVGGPIYTLDQVVEDPQVVHNKNVIHMEHPVCGQIRAIASPIRIKDKITGDPVPPATYNQHGNEVLKDILGYSDEKIAALEKDAEEQAGKTKKRANI